MKSLKDLMIAEISGYGWLDDNYKHRWDLISLEQNRYKYSNYLLNLSDEDFLYTYNRVKEDSDDLD